MWTRSIITYSNPSGVERTDPVSVTGSKGEDGEDGKDAQIVKLSGATQIIKVTERGVTTPNSNFTIVGVGINTAITSWQYSVNGGGFSTSLPTGVTRSGNTVTVNPNTSTFTTLSIRAGDGTVSDTFTVARATDGATGSDGSDGEDAITVVLSNESHTFRAGVSNAVSGSTTTDILAYKGTVRVPVNIGELSGLPSGMSHTISSNNTINARITFNVSTSMTSSNGSVAIPLTVGGQSITKTFSYALALKGDKGDKGEQGPRGLQGLQGP